MARDMRIGLHVRTFASAVNGRNGDQLVVDMWETSCEKLWEIMMGISRRKWTGLKHTTLANRAYRVVQGRGAPAVTHPQANRLTGAAETMDDGEAARRLADPLW